MSERRRRPRDPGNARGNRLRRPEGYSEEAILSEAEVERRINVEGGGAQLQAPPAEHAFRDRQPTPETIARRERTPGRDSLLLGGLIVAGLIAVGLLLPDGPLTSSATAPPSAQGTAAAVAPSLPTTGPAHTGGLITLPPGPSTGPTPIPATEAPVTPVGPGATTAPRPAATPRPAPTPRITPKPTKTPSPTPTRTPTPTKTPGPTPPGTATLVVTISVSNADGGSAPASDWTVTVTSAGTATPETFAGSGSGTNVTITAGASYSVGTSGPSGYASSSTADCASSSGGLPGAGSTQTCTISKNDIAPQVTVTTTVNGGPAVASDWTVSVSATDADPASFAGSSSGVTVRFDADSAYTITSEDPAGTDYTLNTSAGCSGAGLALNGSATCTFTYDYTPPPTEPVPAPGVLLPLLFLGLPGIGAGLRGRRRWPTTPRG